EEGQRVQLVVGPGVGDHGVLEIVPGRAVVEGAPVGEPVGAAADPDLGGAGLQRAAAAVQVEPDHQLGAGGLAAGHFGFAEPDVVGGVVGAEDALAGVPGGDRGAHGRHLGPD